MFVLTLARGESKSFRLSDGSTITLCAVEIRRLNVRLGIETVPVLPVRRQESRQQKEPKP